jgi:hypothetical protein
MPGIMKQKMQNNSIVIQDYDEKLKTKVSFYLSLLSADKEDFVEAHFLWEPSNIKPMNKVWRHGTYSCHGRQSSSSSMPRSTPTLPL